jgi:hypothetical protein
MLDKQTIKTLRLQPEVDMKKAIRLPFNNSDKQAQEVILGNEDVVRTAFLVVETATKHLPESGNKD